MEAARPDMNEEELMQKHIGLVRYILKRDFSGLKIEYEDAFQIGMEALLQAVRTYDPSKEAALSTWAVIHIRSALLKAHRATKAKSRMPSQPLLYMDAPISEDCERTREVADPGQAPEQEAISRVQVQKLLDRLGPKDRKIAAMLADGASIRAIADAVGWSPGTVQKRIIKMRKIIEEEKSVTSTSNKNKTAVSLSDMNALLFEQMKRLGDGSLVGEALKEEAMRSKAMADVATRIIQSGELALRAHTINDKQVDRGAELPLLFGDNG